MEYGQFERRILGLIFRSNVPLTPVHLAYHLDISISEARLHLDRMVASGVLELDSDERGNILFVYPLRPPLETLKTPSPPRRRRRRRSRSARPTEALVPVRRGRHLVAIDEERSYSPAAAAALSLFLPGVGQIYSGRVPQGVGWMLATGLGYLLFLVPGLILHICCIVNAAAQPARLPDLAPRPA
jgi:TM2 domain-containing membrane protein YozV